MINAYQARARVEILYRRTRLAALSPTQGKPGKRIWDEAHDEWERVELAATFIAARHGYLVTEQRRRPLGFVATCFCGTPILHPLRGIPCEFEGLWEGRQWSPPCNFDPEWVGCQCNGCVLNCAPTSRPKVYCSNECKARMRKAVNRAKRRAEGKNTRAVDEIADPIAELLIVYPKPRNR